MKVVSRALCIPHDEATAAAAAAVRAAETGTQLAYVAVSGVRGFARALMRGGSRMLAAAARRAAIRKLVTDAVANVVAHHAKVCFD